MPTNLGDLPLNLPAPVPHGPRSIAWVSTTGVVNNTWAAGTPLPNGLGGYWQISVAPLKRAFWVVEATVMMTSNDVIWSSAYFGARISPADLDGVVLGNYLIGNVHASVPWRSFQSSYPFRLEAGVTYTATLCFEASSNNTQSYHTHPYYTHLDSTLVAEGVV